MFQLNISHIRLKNKKASSKEPPTNRCNVHSLQNTTKEFKAPTINIIGEKELNLTVGDKYTEKGATAKDELDGDLTNKIETSGNVNTSKAGKYEITYKVKNSKGKETTVKRTINVKEKESSKPATNTTTDKTNTTSNKTNSTTGGNTTQDKNNTTSSKDTTKKEDKKTE